MCQFFSCIVTKDKLFGKDKKGKVYYDTNTSSHEDIINMNQLDDSKINNREFVRIEITPTSPDKLFSMDRGDWVYSVDEPVSIPSWYENNMGKYEERAWAAWEEVVGIMAAVLKNPYDNEDFLDTMKIVNDVNAKLCNLSFATHDRIENECSDLIREINGTFRIEKIISDRLKDINLYAIRERTNRSFLMLYIFDDMEEVNTARIEMKEKLLKLQSLIDTKLKDGSLYAKPN